MTMRLLFLTNLFPPYVVGGNELLCADVTQALAERGHDVAVLCGRGNRFLPEASQSGPRAQRTVHPRFDLDLDAKEALFVEGRPPAPLAAFRRFVFHPGHARITRQIIRAFRPDRIVSWNLHLLSLAPLYAARRSGVPVIAHAFDRCLLNSLCNLPALMQASVPWKVALIRITQRTFLPLMRRRLRPLSVIHVSEQMARTYAAGGFILGPARTLHTGVDCDRFPERKPIARSDAAPLRLLYVGSLWEGKGLHTVLRPLGALLRAGLPFELDVYGTGCTTYLDLLRRLISEEGLTGRVHLHGQVERERMRAVYAEHDLLIFPSLWEEPFASVVLEAMSSALPILATTAGGTSEAVRDGVEGLLIPPGDEQAMTHALRQLMQDAILRQRLGAAAAHTARLRFRLPDYVTRLEQAYLNYESTGDSLSAEPRHNQRAIL
ncbi:MAG: glycosyltransferase family 4 protein [Vicinamibacteria bacterium]|nr:glycosyltransferase family 4 protein [Vicinamibacteria bacterium]